MHDIENFKKSVIKGGGHLILRQIIGLLLSIISLTIIFKYLGPKNFGYLSITQGIWGYITLVSTLGLDVFFIRSPKQFEKKDIYQLFTVLFLISITILIVSLLLADVIGYWIGDSQIIVLFRFYSIIFFIKQLGLIPQAILDKNLKYKEIGIIELVSQILYYCISIPLVLYGFNYWGVVIGYLISSIISTSILFYLNPVKFNFKFQMNLIEDGIRYGLSYQFAVWVWQLRDLTIPLIVSKIGGVHTAGLLSAVIQLINRLSFFRTIIWRISLSSLAKLQNDLSLMKKSINMGTLYQVLILGSIFLIFILLNPFFINLIGSRWEKINNVFPFIAVGILFNAAFSLQCSAMFVKGYNFAVNKFHMVNVAILWLFSAILTPVLGVLGFCVAELLSLSSYLLLQKQTKVFLNLETNIYSLIILLVFSLSLMLPIVLPNIISLGIFVISIIIISFLFRKESQDLINDLKNNYFLLTSKNN